MNERRCRICCLPDDGREYLSDISGGQYQAEPFWVHNKCVIAMVRTTFREPYRGELRF